MRPLTRWRCLPCGRKTWHEWPPPGSFTGGRRKTMYCSRCHDATTHERVDDKPPGSDK